MTPMDSIKDVVRSYVKVAEFDKHLKKAGGHIDRYVEEITIKMMVWLVSLFNGISTFTGYLMPKPFS